MKSNSRFRIRIVFIGVIVFAFIIISKLYVTQVAYGDAYRRKADEQYYNEQSSFFDRGSILFTYRNGTPMPTALIKEGYEVYLNPQTILNPEDIFNELSSLITLDENDFMAKANDRKSKRKVVFKMVDKELADRIRVLKIPGVFLSEKRSRYYPAGPMASHILGFVGWNKEGKLTGQYGLEDFYNDILNRDEEKLYSNFFADLFSGIDGKDETSMAGNIETGIEPEVQRKTEEILKEISNTWKSESMGIIVMNPSDGQIYAMAGMPDFDPNNFGSAPNVSVYKNRMVQDRYELGSIMKPITMAIGLDSGAIDSDSKYNDTGFITLNGKTISNFDKKARGNIAINEVLNQSLNVGATYIALKVGQDKFTNYMQKIFGKKTGIDQPGEVLADLRTLTSGRDIDIATASYGQNISITPISMVRALSILANGGNLITPHIAKSINYEMGWDEDIKLPAPERVISKESAEVVTSMLVDVVDHSLRNGQIKNDKYSVAAKTGTAQIVNSAEGGYYKDRFLHSFFGYFPATNPRFIVFLYQVHPKGAEYASETLTDPFVKLTDFLIKYYEIPPDR